MCKDSLQSTCTQRNLKSCWANSAPSIHAAVLLLLLLKRHPIRRIASYSYCSALQQLLVPHFENPPPFCRAIPLPATCAAKTSIQACSLKPRKRK